MCASACACALMSMPHLWWCSSLVMTQFGLGERHIGPLGLTVTPATLRSVAAAFTFGAPTSDTSPPPGPTVLATPVAAEGASAGSGPTGPTQVTHSPLCVCCSGVCFPPTDLCAPSVVGH